MPHPIWTDGKQYIAMKSIALLFVSPSFFFFWTLKSIWGQFKSDQIRMDCPNEDRMSNSWRKSNYEQAI